MNKICKLNTNKFDVIDTEEKAYWIGFIWCDGYNSKRYRRKNSTPNYEFKLSLMEDDIGHLEKFKSFLESEHPIKRYNYSSFDKPKTECRLLLANTKFGKVLDEKYGLIANRTDVNKLICQIPKDLIRHFIRGIFDADGSFSKYQTIDEGHVVTKYNVSFTTYSGLLDFINKELAEQNISRSKINSYYQRHKDRDGDCRCLTYSGRLNCNNILSWMYEDSKVYLDRKFLKYIELYKIN